VPDANVGLVGDASQEIDGQVEDVDEDEEDPCPKWNPAIPAEPELQQLPQHLELPQHFIDLDLSSSSMRFLRASDPNISLDKVLQGFSSNDRSSSSDATSIPDEN
jgi:hypothetical protein